MRKPYFEPLKHKLPRMLVFIISMFLFVGAYAQQKITVTGKVTSQSSNEALTGVTILEKGTTNGTLSSADGSYTITVDPNATLIFSFVGMKTQEISCWHTKKN